MFDDPRVKARAFLESSSIVSELEDVLNQLIYEKPDDLHGYFANYFLEQSKQAQIATLSLRQLIGSGGEPAINISLAIALRNRTERHDGLTVHLGAEKSTAQTSKQLEALVSSASLRTILNRIELFDQTAIDEQLGNFRSEHANEMSQLAAAEAEKVNEETPVDLPTLKTPTTKRPAVSPGAAKSVAGAAPASKKGAGKDTQAVEIIPDEPEPTSFAGQLLIPGISLSCRLIAAQMQQSSLYRLLQLPSLSDLSMPFPIIPILQSGPTYPGKQSLIKYFMLIPSPTMIHNEEWIHKVHAIIQSLRDSLTTAKGAILQSSYATGDGCLVYPLDKPEQGFDVLQNAVNSVCGTEEHWFDYAVQMGSYEAFDYARGKYEVMTGLIKSPDELADVYAEWLEIYPRCIMLIDPFRYADKSSLARLCDRVSNKCYVASTDIRRYRTDTNNNNNEEDYSTMNCHLLSLDTAPTISELMQRVTTLRTSNTHALGLFEREHQEIAQIYLADLAVGLGCRFVRLSGTLSLGGDLTSRILQRLSIIRDQIEMNDGDQFAWPKQHDFVHIRSGNDLSGQEQTVSPPPAANAKNKDKKKK